MKGPLLLSLLAVASLAACDKAPDRAPASQSEERAKAGVDERARTGAAASPTVAALTAPAIRAAADAKLKAYLDAYADFYDRLAVVHESFVRLDIARASPAGDMTNYEGGLADEIRNLKVARALPGSDGHDFDALTDRLMPRIEALDRELSDLAASSDGRGHAEDKLAKGRARYWVVVALFESATEAGTAVERAMMPAVTERDPARHAAVKALRAGGDSLRYNAALAMSQGKALVESFEGAANLKRAGLYAVADPIDAGRAPPRA